MKKILCISLATLLLLGSAGCAQKGAPSGSSSSGAASSAASGSSGTGSLSGKISMLSWNNETFAAPFLKAFNEKYPGISIDFQYAPPVKDYVEKLSTMLYSGSAPDIFQMALENREDLEKGKYAEDLSGESYMKDGTIPDFAKAPYSQNGKVFALAIDGWVGGLFYNKDMFQKAGITGEPQTWDEFLTDCKKLKSAGYSPLMDNLQDAAVNIVPALVGAQTISKDKDFTKNVYAGKNTFADGWDEPLKLWHNLIESGYLTKDMVGVASDQMLTEFATQKVAMIPSGPWNISTLQKLNPKLSYKCMGIPGTEKGNIWYDGAVDVGFCVNAASSDKNKTLAKTFLSFMATPEGEKAFFDGYGSTIIAKGYESPTNDIMKDAVAAFKSGKTYIPMGDWTSYSEALRNTYLTSLQDCLVGKIQPDQVSKNMQNTLKKMSNQ